MELMIKSFVWSKGSITRKLGEFMQACSAFIFLGLNDLPADRLVNTGLSAAQLILQSNLPALSEIILKKVFQVLTDKYKDVKKLSYEQKQVFFDNLRSLGNFLLMVPDSPEAAPFVNLDVFVDTYRGMKLTGEDKLFFLDGLHTAIVYLTIQQQDKLPYRLKNVKSNDQLFKGEQHQNAIMDKLMTLFEDFYGLLEELKDPKSSTQPAETAHLALRIIHSLTAAFKEKTVINKSVKALLTLAGECIKLLKNKGEIRRTVRHLKRTIRECFLEDNPKLAKLSSSLYTFFDEKKAATPVPAK